MLCLVGRFFLAVFGWVLFGWVVGWLVSCIWFDWFFRFVGVVGLFNWFELLCIVWFGRLVWFGLFGRSVVRSVGRTVSQLVTLFLPLPTVRAVRQLLSPKLLVELHFMVQFIGRCLYKHGFYDVVFISNFKTRNW